mgnify:CR=1 FL=1
MPNVLICPRCHEEQYSHEPNEADTEVRGKGRV